MNRSVLSAIRDRWVFLVVALAATAFLVVRFLDPSRTERQVVEVHLPAGGMTFGDRRSQITILEFGSVYCSLCREFQMAVLPAVAARYLEPGRVSYRYVEVDPDSGLVKHLALAGCMAPEVGFTEALDLLFEVGPTGQYDKALALAAARAKGSARSLQQCVDVAAVETRARQEGDAARSLGVMGFPTFVIGIMDESGCMHGWPYFGLPPVDSLIAYVDGVFERFAEVPRPIRLNCGLHGDP